MTTNHTDHDGVHVGGCPSCIVQAITAHAEHLTQDEDDQDAARRRGLWLDHRRGDHRTRHCDGCGLCEMLMTEQLTTLSAALGEVGQS